MIAILTLSIWGFFVYSNSFHNSFHYDDSSFIVSNPSIRDIHNLRAIFNCYPTRFLSILSFALNYHWGGLDVRGYHVLNLLIHLITSGLVYWLALLMLRSPWIAFFSGLIFLVHPVQTEPVNYIFQRGALLATLFYLGALTLYAKARLVHDENPKNHAWKSFYAGAILAALLGMLSKEISVTLPVMIVIYEWIFLKNFKKAWKFVIPFFVIILMIPFLKIHSLNFLELPKVEQNFTAVPVWPYFFTQFRVEVTYLRLLFLPFHQTVVYDYPMAKSLFEIPVMLSILFLLFILAMALRVKKTFPVFSFGIFWFFITLLPESSFIPINNLICEYRLYLPMAGFSLFLSSGLFYLFKEKKGTMAIRILLLIVLVYSVMTYQRNRVWKDEFSLWDDAVHKSPKSSLAYLNRGAVYQAQGDIDHAMQDYNMIIGLGPVTAVTLSNRGAIFRLKGDFDHALANFNLAIKINPSYAGTYYNRGLLYKEEGEFDLAIADFSKALEFKQDEGNLYELRAETYFLNKEYDKAWQDIRAIERSGGKPSPLLLEALKSI